MPSADDDSDTGYGWVTRWADVHAQGAREFQVVRRHACEFVGVAFALYVAAVLRRVAYLRHVPMSAYVRRAVKRL